MRIGTQLFVFHQTWHKQGGMVQHWDEVFADAAAAGVDGVEANLLHLDEHEATLRRLLDQHHLALSSVFASGNLHEEERAEATIAEVMRLAPRAKAMGAEAISFNSAPRKEPRKTDLELRRQADGLNELGRQLKAIGLDLNIHTHDPEMLDDAREFCSQMDLTDPALVGMCMDTHWVYRGGGDVLALAKRYANRINSLHVRQSENGVWAETFGPGDLDYPALVLVLKDAGFDGWVIVELALEEGTPSTQPLVESMRQSVEYARSVFGVE